MALYLVLEDAVAPGQSSMKAGRLIDDGQFNVVALAAAGVALVPYVELSMAPILRAWRAQVSSKTPTDLIALLLAAGLIGGGGGGGAVSSVFGRIGAVAAAAGDYDSDEVDNASAVTGATVSDALETLAAAIPPPAPVDSVFGRTGAVVAAASDYDASQVDNDSSVAGADVAAALDTLGTAVAARALASRVLTAGAGLTGGGDLSADRTFNVGANADGSITVNADDVQVGVLATDAQHGVRGGGTQHATAIAAGAAGFMSGADKTKIDALVAPSYPSVDSGTSRTLVTGDNGARIRFDAGTDVTVTIPTLGQGHRMILVQEGAGQLVLTASGVTLRYDSTTFQNRTAAAGSSVYLEWLTATIVLVVGDLELV